MQFSRIIKSKLSEADWFLIIAHLIPVYGLWFLKWNASEIFIVFCLETIIIGIFTLVKLGIATVIRKKDWLQNNGTRTRVHGIYFIIFFLLHYGLFVSLQLNAFLSITSGSRQFHPSVSELIFHPFSYLSDHSWLLICVFLFAYGYETLSKFILNNEYRMKPFMRIMFEPYLRIFIQQFIVLFGGIALALGAGNIFIVLFIFIKIFFTVFINYDAILSYTPPKNTMTNVK